MAAEQISPTKSEPDDTEIFGWNVKKLKQYISQNSSTNTTPIKDKQRLRFIAMDCTPWTLHRIDKLDSKCRGFLIEKIKSKLSKSQIETYLNPKPNDTETRTKIITEILQILHPENKQKTDQNQNKNNEIHERTLVLPQNNNNNDSDDDMSSVSTHGSMPSLMSDDESDESETDDEDESDSDEDDALIGFEHNDEKSDAMKAIKPPRVFDTKTKKNNQKNDDFLSGMQGAFLNKTKKKQSKKKTVKKNKITTPNAKNNNINAKKNENIIEKMEEIVKEFGYHLRPMNIDAGKNSNGDIFICIGPRKEAANLSEYRYLKCWIVLKNKLKKKGKKKPFHNSVLLDFRKKSESDREIARETLKMGFENVLSFDLHPNHFILEVKEENYEGKLSIENAFKQYEEDGVVINDKFYAKKQDIIEQKSDEIIEQKVDESPKTDKNIKKSDNNIKKNDKNMNKKEKNVNKSGKNMNKNEKNVNKSKKNDKNINKNDKNINKNDKNINKKEKNINKNEKNINKSDKNEKNINKSDKNNNKNDKNINKKKKNMDKNAKINKINTKNKSELINSINTSHITCTLMNDCRLNHFDICMLINDDSMTESISDNNFYVRVRIGSNFRIGCIDKIIDYPSKYKFINNIYTTKAFSIRIYNNKIINKKFTQISNDDFSSKEIDLWINKMKKENTQIPDQKQLIIAAETLDIIRMAKKSMQKQQKTRPKTSIINITSNNNDNNIDNIEPGSVLNTTQNNTNIAPLNAETLAQLNDPSAYKPNAYLQHYITVIKRGYCCFWCIPAKDEAEDSVYIAFLLAKSSKNDPILSEAEDFARKLSVDIKFAEIRETTEKDNPKNASDFWKAKGRLFDCVTTQNAWNLYAEIDANLLAKSYGRKYQTNFVRYVDKEFGAAFIKVQTLSKKEKPKLSKELRVKPHGPKVNYTAKQGEPSFATISEIAPADCVMYGEASVIGDEDDVRSHMSFMTNKTVSKYDQVYNEMRENQLGRMRFVVDDRVLYENEEYEVIHIGKDGNIRIENDHHSTLVPAYVLSKI